jgi:NAD(P)-dependent dehydrogenase (short-subunit alcohol dehydrogenase family)
MQIRDSVFIVTGGASGLGAGTVRALAGQGGKVVAADVNRAAGEALAAKLGDAVRFVECDVTSEEHGKRAVDAAVSAFGGLTGLVNCAGVGVPGRCSARTVRCRWRNSRRSSAST